MLKKCLSIAALAAAAMFSGTAHAALAGTAMTVSVNHAGAFSGLSALNNQSYTYGDVSPYTVPGWGSLTITGPGAIGYDNAIKIDFSAFNYSAFNGQFATIGTAKIQNLAESFDLSSVKVLVNGLDMTQGVASVANGFAASWNTSSIFAMNPISPNVVIAWNSAPTPAPGPLALLGLAGCAAVRGRRRA
jgi:MYXO-CTERM domain-containing protein